MLQIWDLNLLYFQKLVHYYLKQVFSSVSGKYGLGREDKSLLMNSSLLPWYVTYSSQ